MHPYLTEQLVRDHRRDLEREAREHALARAASASTPRGRAAVPGRARFMPHVQEGGRLRRMIAALLGPQPA